MDVHNIRAEGVSRVTLHVAVTRERQTATGCAKTNSFSRGHTMPALSAYSWTLYVSAAALVTCRLSVNISHARGQRDSPILKYRLLLLLFTITLSPLLW